ncbi:hypothetical protein TSUD_307190 [Trifolium subterraneum]|uniref:Uncharacterized protein n=1 Tax=Trifolium subterraneum TaxID=3900 RepID=A0A2Z6M440_TRISU|nr:hypothetical protein TSUD_307190 [Trifolium subterraneum]
MMQYYLQGLHGDPSTSHFIYGRNNNNYINGSDAEVLRGGIMQSHQMNYPSILPVTTGEEGGGFSISGLNLNLGSGGGGGAATTTTQHILRPMQHSQYAMADNVSLTNMNMNSVGTDQNINNFVGYNGMEHCMDLDTYWPNSY